MGRHLVSIRSMERSDIEELLSLGFDFKERVVKEKALPSLGKRVVGMLFFEDSTRTRMSFEQAAYYLGLKTANFSSSGSSMSKGETLKDTILTLRYERLSGLVMRHSASGAPYLAARFFGGPVLNAGDGQHEHPTQALGDAMTIIERKGQLDGLRVSIVGDVLHSRVARSNAWLLSKLGAEVRFVGPRTLMPKHTGRLPGEVFYDLEAGIEDADVVMCLRLQRERMTSGLISSINEYAKLYQITRDRLGAANPKCLVMHPGPLNRGIELDDQVADSESSIITAQVENGVFIRMASLYWVFNEPPKVSAKPKRAAASARRSK